MTTKSDALICPHCGKSIRDTQHAVNEVGRLHAKNERLRAALEQYADTSNWIGKEWRGEGNGWVLAQRTL